MKFLTNLNLNGNQLLNAVLHTLSGNPGSPVEGQFWYNSDTDLVGYQDGTTTRFIASQTWVTALRLDQLAAPNTALSMGSQRVTNVADPTSAQDAATKAYVDALVNGTDWKQSVRAVSTTNITLSGTQTIDDISLVDGDRILVTGQSTASENGIYVVATGAWSRATDADADAEVTSALAVYIEEGTTYGSTQWRLTTTGTIIVDTTNLTFEQFGAGTSYTEGTGIDISGSTIAVDTTVVATKYTTTVGDNSSTSIVVTHDLGTRAVVVEVFESGSPYASVICDVEKTSINTVTLKFASAPTTNEYTVVVIG